MVVVRTGERRYAGPIHESRHTLAGKGFPMNQTQEATEAGVNPKNLTAEQLLMLREFVRSVGGIEQARRAAEEVAKSQKAA